MFCMFADHKVLYLVLLYHSKPCLRGPGTLNGGYFVRCCYFLSIIIFYHVFVCLFRFRFCTQVAFDWDNGSRWRRRVMEGEKKNSQDHAPTFIRVLNHELDLARKDSIGKDSESPSPSLVLYPDKAVIVLRPFEKVLIWILLFAGLHCPLASACF